MTLLFQFVNHINLNNDLGSSAICLKSEKRFAYGEEKLRMSCVFLSDIDEWNSY